MVANLLCWSFAGRDKSSSAPHLMPGSQWQQRADTDLFMNLDFDNRNRTGSLSCAHRPRGSSWSQSIRPRSSTNDHKRRTRTQRLCNTTADGPGDYIDMTQGGTTNGYVEMSLDKSSKHRLEFANHQNSEKEDKENDQPAQIQSSHSPRVPGHGGPLVVHPFPQLMSASSDDDVSLNSIEGSASLHSLASSADSSMSASSHSSYHSSAFTTPLDAEPYVAMQPYPVPMNSSSYVRSNTHRLFPVSVPSYIVDESEDIGKSSTANGHSDYMEMAPSVSKHTKQ